MTDAGRVSLLSLFALREVRAYIRRSHAIAMTVFFGVVYALGSMTLGGMIVLARLSPPYYTEIIWGQGFNEAWWQFPAFVVWAPWGTIVLPFFATWAAVVVSIGVAIGMAVAVLLSVELVRQRVNRTGTPALVSSAAGLTPAMLALVTLGACCGTTAAATAGVGAIAQITGSNTDNLLTNSWFLGVFQMAVVWVALLAQEMLLEVFGDVLGLSGRSAGSATERATYVPPRRDLRFAAAALLRAALLLAGLTWALAMFVEWTTVSPVTAGAVQWTAWVLEYELVGILAVAVALFPRPIARAFLGAMRHPGTLTVRGLALLGGLALVGWVPPPFSGQGLEGLGNELLYLLGAPASWGAVAPVFGAGPTLLLRWGLQYGLLGGFAIAVALAPARALGFLERTVGTVVPAPARRPTGGVRRPSVAGLAGAGPDGSGAPTQDG
ncbi:MAG TPA: hypothetical protein VMG99_08495 [Thermoplasmata archaeon]|nr:hypothetical protein [Thermoplasmata archaeon]HTW56384.1 hypothetical protein [Thermoplasmata archaeon]